MLAITIATIAVGFAQQGAALSCPVSGQAAGAGGKTFAYNGALFQTCCGGCAAPFASDPAKALKSDALKGKTVGVFMFDPVAGTRIEPKKAKASSLYYGISFHFASEKNKQAFDKDPKRYGTLPEKEALYCPVMGHAINGYAEAGAFVDHEGVRYYVCCPNCLSALRTAPAKHVGKAASAVKAPVAIAAKEPLLFAQAGKDARTGSKDECCSGGGCEGSGACCKPGEKKRP